MTNFQVLCKIPLYWKKYSLQLWEQFNPVQSQILKINDENKY